MELSIDLGSSLCKVVVAKKNDQKELEILGVGMSPNYGGIKQGVVVNIEQTIRSVEEALEEACLQAGVTFDSATVNITGKNIRGENSRGVVAISNENRIVKEEDIYRVIQGARNVRIPTDQEIIHILSRSYTLDNQEGIKDPLGMTGIRLEAEVHLVSANITSLSNINRVFAAFNLECRAVVMSSLASANALLSEEEKELGLCVADIGSETTDIIIYHQGGIAYSSTIPYAGQHITHDLSVGLKVPLATAEITKKTHGCADSQLIDPLEKIELPQIGGRGPREIPRQVVAEIIQARVEEILKMIDEELVKSSVKPSLIGGVVLCGGTSLLEGIADLSSEKIGLATCVRSPEYHSGFSERVHSPEFATAAGILNYLFSTEETHLQQQTGNRLPIFHRLRKWFSESV